MIIISYKFIIDITLKNTFILIPAIIRRIIKRYVW